MRYSSVVGRLIPDSSASLTGLSIFDGSIGKRMAACLIAPVPTTDRMCSRGTCMGQAAKAAKPGSGRLHKGPRTSCCLDLGSRSDLYFPAWLHEDGLGPEVGGVRPNLSGTAQRYLERLGASVEDLFHSCPRRAARSRLPRGQCRGATHGMAAHPASGMAGWRCRRCGGGACCIGGARPRTGPAA